MYASSSALVPKRWAKMTSRINPNTRLTMNAAPTMAALRPKETAEERVTGRATLGASLFVTAAA
ncbi:MAG: hypothetical protein C4345_14195, partial [Chloroflexota bacterium]